jgi:hypothetical protein
MNQTGNWKSRNLWVVGIAGLVFGGLVAASSGALGGAISFARGKPIPPPAAAKYFEVTVNGINFVNTDFAGVSPISSRTVEGGRTMYEPITIQRHFNGPDELNEWRERLIRTGVNDPRDVVITYFDARLRPIRRVMLQEAWPSGWQTPPEGLAGPEGNEIIRLTFTRAGVR